MATNTDPIKKVFISYARENDDQIKLIFSFANYLKRYGFEVIQDELIYEEKPDTDFFRFMADSDAAADKVVVVLTKRFKQKADKNEGGVGFECKLFFNSLHENPNKYLFVYICEGNKTVETEYDKIVPEVFKGIDVLPINSDQTTIDRLVRKIQGIEDFSVSPVGHYTEVDRTQHMSFFEALKYRSIQNFDFFNIVFHTIVTIEDNDEDFSYEAYRCIVATRRIPQFRMTPQFDHRCTVKLSSKLVSLPSDIEMDEENCVLFDYPIPINNRAGDVIPMHYKMELKAPKNSFRSWDMHSENYSQAEIHDFFIKYKTDQLPAKLFKRKVYSSVEIFVEEIPFDSQNKLFRVILKEPKSEYTYILKW